MAAYRPRDMTSSLCRRIHGRFSAHSPRGRVGALRFRRNEERELAATYCMRAGWRTGVEELGGPRPCSGAGPLVAAGNASQIGSVQVDYPFRIANAIICFFGGAL